MPFSLLEPHVCDIQVATEQEVRENGVVEKQIDLLLNFEVENQSQPGAGNHGGKWHISQLDCEPVNFLRRIGYGDVKRVARGLMARRNLPTAAAGHLAGSREACNFCG